MADRATRHLKGLNPQQCEAVRQTEGPVLVLAGAGSGKTRVITRRIAYILARGLAEPKQVMAVTFTNKAAAEMRERVGELIGRRAAQEVALSTFHSFCLRVLRRHIEHLGYRRNFSIAGESDARALLRRVVDDMSTRERRFSPGTFQAAISLYKNKHGAPDPERPGPVANETEEKYEAHMAHVYERYQSALRAANSLDFDDLLLHTLELWRGHPQLLNRARRQFRYVMVDEYQDTNRVQYELMHMLVAEHRNFCVVGDDDQSIYGWRGADVRNILDFERDFPEARIITLDQNYRSTETILAAANSVIRNNTQRREKKLWSELGKGRALDWFVTADEEAEAKEAVKWLQYIRARTGARFRDFALLYRSNLQSKPLEIAFRQAGIPYVVYGGQDFFERAEVKDIICYLKLIANPHDEAAFLRVINMPRRGIGDVTLHKVHDICREKKVSLGKALAELLKHGGAEAQAKGGAPAAAWAQTERGIRDFLKLIQHFRQRFRSGHAPLHEVCRDYVRAIDYQGELDRTCKNPEAAFNRWQNVELVLGAVEQYAKEAKAPSLVGFLDESHLNTDQDRAGRNQEDRDAVTLMTIHSAKGLEFPYVFIMGIEDGLLPHERSVKENGLDEERRLFYVALTRGRRHVTLFEAVSRTRHGHARVTATSRFTREIPAELVRMQVRAAREMVAAAVAPSEPKPKKRASRTRRRKP